MACVLYFVLMLNGESTRDWLYVVFISISCQLKLDVYGCADYNSVPLYIVKGGISQGTGWYDFCRVKLSMAVKQGL